MNSPAKELSSSLTFHNHASYSVEYGGSTLLTDPWFFGSAFNHGWSLLEETRGGEDSLIAPLTIYVSHEHPDHFNVPYFKSIPEETRQDVTVLFRSTKDGRVAHFLRSNGFNVVELKSGRQYEVGKNFLVEIYSVPFYDSYCIIRLGDRTILNLNDCVLENSSELRKIQRCVPDLDILLTQFSYANWIPGGAADSSLRAEEAERKLERFSLQVSSLAPKVVIPFASMIRFSHPENSYMNDAVVRPQQVWDVVDESESLCCFLRPADKIELEHLDSLGVTQLTEAKEYWESKFEVLPSLPLSVAEESVAFDDLRRAGEKRRKIVAKKSRGVLLRLSIWFGFVPQAFFFITDLRIYAEFSWSRGLRLCERDSAGSQNSEEFQPIELSSASLHHLLSEEFGIDTLSVNGRFQSSAKSFKRLTRTFAPQILLNLGYRFTLLGAMKMVGDRKFRRRILREILSSDSAR